MVVKRKNIAVLLVHEIYGVNEHMKHVSRFMKSCRMDVYCPNLLTRDEPYSYEKEEDAYNDFMMNVGIQKGVHVIQQYVKKLKCHYERVYLLGYSVGATIAWLCSEDDLVDGIIGYYGSRIRDYVHIEPKCPVLLFFSETEKSFNVQHLVKVLHHKENEHIRVHIFPVKHGYANPYSIHYSKQYEVQSMQLTKQFLHAEGVSK
ncbi:dienelactone hydrolase family protein [Bacillus manliponensis]|uniref:dienelactone hydrolase family protein n=1 Tax=Bacillus manliponensis TaxID=574376 RepID=UPI003519D346